MTAENPYSTDARKAGWEKRKQAHGATGKAKPVAASPLLYWKARAEKAEARVAELEAHAVECDRLMKIQRQMYDDKPIVWTLPKVRLDDVTGASRAPSWSDGAHRRRIGCSE